MSLLLGHGIFRSSSIYQRQSCDQRGTRFILGSRRPDRNAETGQNRLRKGPKNTIKTLASGSSAPAKTQFYFWKGI
jgi:hypothetical protein